MEGTEEEFGPVDVAVIGYPPGAPMTGEAIPIRGKYAGSAVNLAARICSFAGPGEVLIGETLHRLVRSMDGLLFLDRGQAQVKGYPDPIRIVQVARENPAAPEGSTSERGAGA